jgi:hypothetical protein
MLSFIYDVTGNSRRGGEGREGGEGGEMVEIGLCGVCDIGENYVLFFAWIALVDVN